MNTSETRPLILVAGPTAGGKTGLAVDLAARLEGEIVGGDSVQVYRRVDIGSAKPAPEELRGISHHLINVADLDESYDAARFVADADAAIEKIRARAEAA